MGCDIHLYVEIKIGGQWYVYNHPHVPRNYELFAIMAGVRNYDKILPIAEPRGIPEDVSLVCGLDYAWLGQDAHSASYLTCEEMGRLLHWFEEREDWTYYDAFGFLFGDSIEDFREHSKSYPDSVQDARVVFWFDN